MHGRRWLQFSLRSCLILVTAVCVWLGWHVRTANRQKEAIKAIEAMGGSVEFEEDGKTPLMAFFRQGAIRQPDGTTIWPPGFKSGMYFYGPKITLTDDGLRHVASLSALQIVWISGVPITDAGLRRLHHLKNLQRIRLGHTHITASAIAEFQKAIPNCAVDVWP